MSQPLSWWKSFYAHTLWQSSSGELTLDDIEKMLDHLIVEAHHDFVLKGGE